MSFKGSLSVEYNHNGKDITILESKVPEIFAPSDVKVDEIVNTFIELPILPDTLQDQLKSMKNWKDTIYVPIVDQKLKEVNVNGNKAYLEATENHNHKCSRIFWLKDGVLVEIFGDIGKNDIIEIAASMR